MPLIYALQNSSGEEQAKTLREAVVNGGTQRLKEVLATIESTGGIAYTEDVAGEQARIAKKHIEALPDSRHRAAMIELTEFAISRTS